MIFRQLLDPETSTYTYLLADEVTREALLIDTVFEQFERDATILRELVKYCLLPRCDGFLRDLRVSGEWPTSRSETSILSGIE